MPKQGFNQDVCVGSNFSSSTDEIRGTPIKPGLLSLTLTPDPLALFFGENILRLVVTRPDFR